MSQIVKRIAESAERPHKELNQSTSRVSPDPGISYLQTLATLRYECSPETYPQKVPSGWGGPLGTILPPLQIL